MLFARHGRLRRRNRKRRSLLLFAALLVAALIALGLATVAFTGQQILLSQCNTTELRPLALGENSFLYTDNGQMLGVIPSATNRQPLPLSQISPSLPQATVAIEDARFWQHGALDYRGILRALYQDAVHGQVVQGGSTITQELVKNLYIGNAQRTVSRKIKEACLATKFFQKNTRKKILADYLNEVFYGRHAYGAQAASRTYFSKPASKLTLVQAALLAGLPQAPTRVRPAQLIRAPRAPGGTRCCTRCGRTATSPSRSCGRRWGRGSSSGRATSTRSSTSRASSAGRRSSSPSAVGKHGQQQVELGGYHVKTTLDQRLQGLATHAVSSVLHTSTDPAAAIVSIDPQTGAVKAMVNYLPSGRTMQFNLATQAHRSTGSAFKPITLATALSAGDSIYSTFYGPPAAQHHHAGVQAGQRVLDRPQLRRRGGGHDQPPRRDGAVREHDLRAAHREDRREERAVHGAQPRDHGADRTARTSGRRARSRSARSGSRRSS